MTIVRSIGVIVVALAVTVTNLWASGPVGIYGVVERLVFEPNEASPERVQLWGAFMFVQGGGSQAGLTTSSAARGYLYFRLPQPSNRPVTPAMIEQVKREWADLAAVAGTGDAVGFGLWGFIGPFPTSADYDPTATRPFLLEAAPRGGARTDLRVRPASEPPSGPTTYQVDAGVIRLTPDGSHAAIVAALQEALR